MKNKPRGYNDEINFVAIVFIPWSEEEKEAEEIAS